jgi:hypothetical protein
MSDNNPSRSELDLRAGTPHAYASTRHGHRKHVHVDKAGRAVCTCGHIASRHGHHRLECAAVDCTCARFEDAAAPAAVAWGDQTHAAMIDAAWRDVRERFLAEGLRIDEEARAYLAIGIGAGAAAAVETLRASRKVEPTP